MSVRLVLISIVGAASATAVGARPEKDPQAMVPAAPTPTVVLASASNVPRQSPTVADRPGEPARHPAPRVTTCRCADQQPAEEQPDK